MGGHRTELGLTVDSAGGQTWNGRWRESLGNRPKIDPKLTQIGPRKLPWSLSGATLGQERPESTKNTRKSHEKRAKGGPKIRGRPREIPKRPPGIDEHAKMRASGTTRKRQKDTSMSCFRLFWFRSLPGVLLGAPGCPRGPFWTPPGPPKSCFRLSKTTIFTFSTKLRFFIENQKKTHARGRLWGRNGPPGPFYGNSGPSGGTPKSTKKNLEGPFSRHTFFQKKVEKNTKIN